MISIVNGPSRRALAVLATGGVLALGLPANPVNAAAFQLPTAPVGFSQPFQISGPGLGDALASARLLVGGSEVNVRLSDGETAQVSLVARDPGTYKVDLAREDGSVEQVGEVEVTKANVPGPSDKSVEGRIKLRLAPGATPRGVLQQGDTASPLIPNSDSEVLGRWWVVDVPVGSERRRIESYARDSKIEVAEFDGTGEAAHAPSDPFYADHQQHLKTARLPSMWEAARAGAPVAVLDSGIRETHDELDERVAHNRDHTGTGTLRCNFHGSAVSGVVAAESDNAAGGASGGFTTRFGSFKVLSGTGCSGTNTNLERAITDSVALGYRVINMSLQNYSNLVSTQDVITNAWNQGAFLVASAGNSNSSDLNYPAAYTNVFSVAASTLTDTKADFSNYGGWVDIAAPGVDMLVVHDGSDSASTMRTANGTSFSAPLVASAAAVLRAAGLANAAIEVRLLNNVDPVNFGATGIGGGRLNAYRAYVPAQGCIRDTVQGSFVRSATGAVYFVDGTVLRHVPNPTVLDSWRAGADVVPICNERMSGFTTSSGSFGYRPGSLVQDSAGTVWLIAAAPLANPSQPQLRHEVSPSARSCLGWGSRPAISDATGVINIHPKSTPVVCAAAPRLFPSGSIVRAPSGATYVIDSITKRHVVTPAAFASWFKSDEVVAASDAELALFLTGLPWQMRPGAVVTFSGNAAQYAVTTGERLGSSLIRHFQTPLSKAERGFGSVPVASEGTTVYMSQAGQLLDGDAQR